MEAAAATPDAQEQKRTPNQRHRSQNIKKKTPKQDSTARKSDDKDKKETAAVKKQPDKEEEADPDDFLLHLHRTCGNICCSELQSSHMPSLCPKIALTLRNA